MAPVVFCGRAIAYREHYLSAHDSIPSAFGRNDCLRGAGTFPWQAYFASDKACPCANRCALLLRYRSRARIPIPDGIAVHHQLHSPITLPPFHSFVAGDRLRFAEPARADRRSCHALLCEEIPHRVRPTLRKLLVHFIASD